jgi:hypothetical protein
LRKGHCGTERSSCRPCRNDPPSSLSLRSRGRTRSSLDRSRARGERVGHTHPAATSRRCALYSRTCRPRQSFAAPAGSARLAAGRVAGRQHTQRHAPHPLSLPQGPFSIRPWRGLNETLCGLSTIPRKAAAAIKWRFLTRNSGRVRRHRKSLPVRIRDVGEESVPDSETGRCVPLATSRQNRFSPQLRARNRHHLHNDDPALKW